MGGRMGRGRKWLGIKGKASGEGVNGGEEWGVEGVDIGGEEELLLWIEGVGEEGGVVTEQCVGEGTEVT
jgi:hypothetical protein